jgi:hypothetical protein
MLWKLNRDACISLFGDAYQQSFPQVIDLEHGVIPLAYTVNVVLVKGESRRTGALTIDQPERQLPSAELC